MLSRRQLLQGAAGTAVISVGLACATIPNFVVATTSGADGSTDASVQAADALPALDASDASTEASVPNKYLLFVSGRSYAGDFGKKSLHAPCTDSVPKTETRAFIWTNISPMRDMPPDVTFYQRMPDGSAGEVVVERIDGGLVRWSASILDVDGGPLSAGVWTGATADGTPGQACDNWTRTGAGDGGGAYGAPSETSDWLFRDNADCSDSHGVYCIIPLAP